MRGCDHKYISSWGYRPGQSTRSDHMSDGTIDSGCAAFSYSHAPAATDPYLHRISSTRTTMESTTPKRFKSNLLAALDFKPNLDNLENNPLLTQTKRKQTPGSPDPRQPKRVAAASRSDIPGLENIVCGCSRTVCSMRDLILLSYLVPAILQPPPSTAGLPKDHRQEFGINYNEDAPISRFDLAGPDQQQQYDSFVVVRYFSPTCLTRIDWLRSCQRPLTMSGKRSL